MRQPMLNMRKPRGYRGERLVAAMRANPNRARGALGIPPSNVYRGQTGTFAVKNFAGAGGGLQPTRPARFLGGLRPVQFGE